MKKIFGDLKMGWFTVILFALVAGGYTGFIMLVPFLAETSFQDIGISYEWWVIFAVIIVVNCDKSWEAALKCFVFFLISQPVVYLVEIGFGDLSLQLAETYYLGTWLPMTFLTLPGGFIAYYCKKQNMIGSIILGLGNTIQVVMGVFYLKQACVSFPNHLISSMVCFASVILMSMSIQKKPRNRVLAMVLPVILTLGIVVYARMAGLAFV